jgi:hypothetical protein
VTVHASEDLAQESAARAALDAAAIPFFTRHEQLQHLIGYGQLGGLNIAVGPPEIQVAAHNAQRAIEAIRAALERPTEASSQDPEVSEADASLLVAVDAQAARYARIAAVASLLWLGGVGSVIGVIFGLRALHHFISPTPLTRAAALFGIGLGLLGLVSSALMYVGTW